MRTQERGFRFRRLSGLVILLGVFLIGISRAAAQQPLVEKLILDETIQPIAPEWPIDQIARVDRTILRMAVYELTESKDVPPKVVINEAVELAKAFGSDNSSKFVNGVLGTAYRTLIEGQSHADAKV